jgi:hypothetical protein
MLSSSPEKQPNVTRSYMIIQTFKENIITKPDDNIHVIIWVDENIVFVIWNIWRVNDLKGTVIPV